MSTQQKFHNFPAPPLQNLIKFTGNIAQTTRESLQNFSFISQVVSDILNFEKSVGKANFRCSATPVKIFCDFGPLGL